MLVLVVLLALLKDVWFGSTSQPAAAQGNDVLVLRFGDPDAVVLDDLIEGVDFHRVRAGETLSSIASRRLGDPALANLLSELNRLDDPDLLLAGQVLYLR